MRLLLGLAAFGALLLCADLAASADVPCAWTQQDAGVREDACPAILPEKPFIAASVIVENVPRVAGETVSFAPAPVPRGLSPPSLA